MKKFEDYVFEQTQKGILGLANETAADVYALSFYFWADEDDPRRAMLTVGYNTNKYWQERVEDASDANEAKWNFAFWLQDQGEACVIGESKADVVARKAWMDSLKIWYSDEEAEEDPDRCYDLDDELMDQFVVLCITVAKRLHAEGVITKKFGRAIPILVHELEYHEGIAEMTKEANPEGLTAEFEKWIAEL